MSNIKLPATTLLLGQPTEVLGLGGIDGGGVGKSVNLIDGVDPQDSATVNNITTAVSNRLIQSGGTTEDNIVTYNASGKAQDSNVDVTDVITQNIQLISVSGTTQSDGSNYIHVDTVAAGASVTVEVRTVDITNQTPIMIKDITGSASPALTVTVVGEGGESIDDYLSYVIDCPFGAGIFSSTGSALVSTRNTFPQSVLIAESSGDQVPTAVYPAVGGLVDVEFGVSQGSSSTPIEYDDITHEFTVNQAGWYEASAIFIVQRSGAAGVETLEIAALANGSLIRKHLPITLVDDDQEQPVTITVFGCFPAGIALKVQMATTSASGAPDIGLYEQTSPVTEWGTPTRSAASVEFKKLI